VVAQPPTRQQRRGAARRRQPPNNDAHSGFSLAREKARNFVSLFWQRF
jgi:hypothetical protein